MKGVHDALESIQIKTNRNQDFLQVNDKEKHYNFFLPHKFEIFVNIVKNLRGRYVFTLFTDIKMYIMCLLRLDFLNSFRFY
jgi:hypothetical protein